MSEKRIQCPVLVSTDKKETHRVYLPGIDHPHFQGISLSTLLDDVALYLMETFPKLNIHQMAPYLFCPYVELRKVSVDLRLKIPHKKEKRTWSGRFAVVLQRWSKEGFFTACIPAWSTCTFALSKTSALPMAVEHLLKNEHKKKHFTVCEELEDSTCRSYEYLEIVEVDVEYPTLLPSAPPKPKKRKHRKQRKRGAASPKRKVIVPQTLRSIAENLSTRARDGRLQPAFGRDRIVQDLRNMLDQEGAAILLVGPAGVGKTAIVHEVIRILSKAQTSLQHRTDVWEIDGNRFIAGMRYVGAWEERCRSMLEELTSLRDILYVNDLPALVYTGRSAHSNTNVAEFLEPALAQKQIRIIGECTQERLSSIREENPGFFSHFRVIQIDALSEKQTLSVLVQHGRHHESQEDIAITPQAFQNILSITTRFQPNQCFPGKAVRLLQQVLCNAPHQHLDAFGRRKIDHRDVTQYFGQETGLPDAVLWREQARSAHQVKQRFERHIIAQEHAVHALTDIVCTIQQALNDPERPLAALLFVGPTGVGKTESAKALATYLFGSAQKMLRFDMSEYGHPWSVARLIGDRFQPEGELTRQVQNAPFSVVLLDEIEKAHPSVFDALLQVLGEGRLTNAYGRTVDFCNCVVIMTSNLGVKQAGRHVGFTHLATTQMDTHYRKAAEQFFRPEFFNRIDKIVPFRLLQRDAIVPLVQRLLQEVLQRRGLRRRQTMVHVDHDVIPFLIERGFEQRYGARSMKRTLEQTLTLPLAQQLVHTTSAQYTLLQVFVQQNQIQLDIQALHEPHTTMVPEVQSIENWDDLKSRFRHLQDRLETFHNHPQLRAAQEQRSQQIHNINLSEQVSDTPAQNEQTQKYLEHIHTLSTLFSEWNALRQECLTFEEKYIQEMQFEEQEIQLKSYNTTKLKLWDRSDTYYYIDHPVLLQDNTKNLILPHVHNQFKALQHRFSALSFRLASLQEPEEQQQALLRILPVTTDASTQTTMLQFAYVFLCMFEAWGDVQLLFCEDAHWSSPEQTVDATWLATCLDNEEAYLRHGWDTRKGVALLVQGPGIQQLARQEHGFFCHHYSEGPDQICDLLRVEELFSTSNVTTDPIDILNQAEQAYQDYRHARREGPPQENPRPPLTLRRLFQEGFAIDPITGEELTFTHHTQTPRTAPDSSERLRDLATQLQHSAMTECLTKHREPSLPTQENT